MTTQFASGNGAALPQGQKPEAVEQYLTRINALRDAAYAAYGVEHNTSLLPHIDRHSLRLLIAEAERLVDDGERSALTDSKITAARMEARA